MSAPLPMVGSGEPVEPAVDALEKAGAAVVLVDGSPAGMITRAGRARPSWPRS